ncbi:MAG: GNAT family N-acetyltransferase [Nocardioidaceae bacterium]
MAADYWLRPMTADDVPAVERLTDQAFHDLELRLARADRPPPTPRSPGHAESWRAALTHLVGTDPRGCFVAEDGAGMLGAAVGMRRELTWLLSALAVRPGVQGRGVGRQLLAAAEQHGAGCLRAMLAASDDPAALRRYRTAGFDLHPTMCLHGRVPRSALPVLERVREGSAGDADLLDSVDRRVRHAAHGADHELLSRTLPLVVVDRATGSGYAYVRPGGGPYLLAATNRRTAVDLLWATLAACDPEAPVSVEHVSAANQWAIDVATDCRLSLGTRGFLGVRGMRPPTPYLPSGQFL